MNRSSELRLNNRLTYLAASVLISCFLFTLLFVIIPQLPNYPRSPEELRLFVSTWNFACTLMWVMVLRIQVLNEMSDSIKREENRRRVTPWVRFWFVGSVLIGSATVVYVINSFLTVPSCGPPYADLLSAFSIVFWVSLVALSLQLFSSRGKATEEVFPDVERALPPHRWFLVPASVLFFLSAFLFPLFFLL